eukprot:CAMPEP_0172561144 /NCGR_PEP_ID=MMETSP1067-20121228/91757_1 /TAXON_ID=265564 ORGANISM="Thalassiosira punctigera, Strain Tpunct2005C2" /NCGR_SAMPLE_ID=MMETSP1067 /ASSEMBLY_ACC=CAM_ASM_000444 /LENGTH=85 /DNA_ID=CAMNT_0013351125 /DNA_START=159 /DNA_END=416 /DNA_ORIENTATION=+
MAEYAEMNTHDTSAFMGLENYLSPDRPHEVKLRRRSIWNAVLSEQQRQVDADIEDPKAISKVAESFSDLSRKRARIIGLLHSSQT